jgi:hypothetical protein
MDYFEVAEGYEKHPAAAQMSPEALGGLLVYFIRRYESPDPDNRPEIVLDVPVTQLKSELLCDVDEPQSDTMLVGEIPTRKEPRPEPGYRSRWSSS